MPGISATGENGSGTPKQFPTEDLKIDKQNSWLFRLVRPVVTLTVSKPG